MVNPRQFLASAPILDQAVFRGLETLYDRRVLEELSPDDPYDDSRPAVWPDLPSDPIEFVVCGEAPGKNEVKEGRIFIGESGQLLREIVAEAGLTSVHYTNASLWRPTIGKEDKPPSPKLIRRERGRLLMEISMLKPKAIVGCGATAWYALLGDQARMRGMVKELTAFGRVYPVYLTWHPAYSIYNPDVYVDIVKDFARVASGEVPARALRQAPAEGLPPEDADILSIDTESTHAHFPTAEFLTCTISDGERYWEFGPARLKELDAFLRRYRGRLVTHNGLGDEILLRRMGVEVCVTDDTLLKHVSQDERKGSHKLKILGPTVAKVDTGIDWVWHHTHKHAGKRESERDEEKLEWKDIPREDLVPYCGQDAIVTAQLYRALERIDDNRARGVYRFLQRAFRTFSDGTDCGVMVDQKALQSAAEEVGEEVKKLEAGFSFNPESHPQTLAALKEAGYRVKSTGIDILQELEGELPEQLRAYREVEKLYNGFLQPLPKLLSADGKVRATYKIHGTDSGRTSCADPNLQQVPPSLRHLFIAKPGHVFIGWDFKVHEVRGLAYYSGDQTLAEFLRDESADPHLLVADRIGFDRQVGKGSVFAVAYGASPGKLVRQFGISPAEADRAYNAVRELFPGLDSWKDTVYKAIDEVGYVETPYGRQRWFHLITRRGRAKAERIAVNFLVQSFCGDIALESAIAVYEELGYPPLIFVHDFNTIEVPEKVAERVREKAEQIVRAVFKNDLVQFVPEFYIGKHWGELKHA